MSDLRGVNPSEEVKVGGAGKAISAVIIVAALIGIGVYAYESGGFPVRQHVASNQLPSPTPPSQQ